MQGLNGIVGLKNGSVLYYRLNGLFVVTKQAELSSRVLDMFIHHNNRDKCY
jgi:hypothetical protein